MSDQSKEPNDEGFEKLLDDILSQSLPKQQWQSSVNVTQMVLRPLTPEEFTTLYACVELGHRVIHGDAKGAERALEVLDRRGHGVCDMAHLFQRMAKMAMGK